MPFRLTLSSCHTPFALALVMSFALPALGIQPGRWTHTSEADFEPGEVDGTVVTNLGDVKLAAATSVLDELPEGVTLIYDIETVDGVTYLAAGPEGKLLKIEDGKAVEVAGFENEQVFCLYAAGNGKKLLVGISGNPAKVMIHQAGAEPITMELPDDRFVWDMTTLGDHDRLLVATGPEGRILSIDGPDQIDVVLDTAQANVLCLAASPA